MLLSEWQLGPVGSFHGASVKAWLFVPAEKASVK